ncbi:MAG: sulfatase-like hydrolase/transferase [Planctomycetes bacterium]|nr:sulfatase-like hydrolase/transferase [Planctomycetota bacterium]
MNIILIVIDNLKAAKLGCYGYFRDTTPNLDRLAKEGFIFENCIAQCAHTMPSFTTILTGQDPFTHGMVGTLWCVPNAHNSILDDETPVLAEIFRAAGYTTAAFDNLFSFANRPKWFVRGNEWYVDVTKTFGRHHTTCLRDIDVRLLPWLREHARENLFLFVHPWDTHSGEPAEEFNTFFDHRSGDTEAHTYEASSGERYIRHWGRPDRLGKEGLDYHDRWDNQLRSLDNELGCLFDTLSETGLLDRSWLILTADHGNDTREHNSYGHREVYEESIRVPLIVRPPKEVKAGGPRRIGGLAAHTDLMPTILDLAGLQCERAAFDGQSLRPVLEGGAAIDRDAAFATGCYVQHGGLWKSCEICVRTPEWKYIERGEIPEANYDKMDLIGMIVSARGASAQENLNAFRALPRCELYNLRTDPEERVNMCDKQPNARRDLAARLDSRRTSQWFV